MQGYAEQLATFVPAAVLRRLAGVDASASGSESIQAALLFADVSGFSQLAANLALQGPAGAEALNTVLNEYFSTVLETIRKHGGEVVKFAGDAVFALWPAGVEPLHVQVARAAACGFDANEALVGVAGGLTQRIAIGAGSVNLVYAGAPSPEQFFVVVGDGLTQALHAQEVGSPGGVTLSSEAARLIADHRLLEPLALGRALLVARPAHISASFGADRPLPLPLPTTARIEAYVPPPVRTRLAAGQAEWLADLRRVSVLFVNVGGVEHAAKRAERRIADALAIIQPIVARHDGFINQVLVDDKGIGIVVFMGLPPQAHEDNAFRCVRAAIEIRDSLAHDSLQTSIGVASGTVFAGPIGVPWRRDYTAIGETVNLAARFMAVAAGSIVVDEATQGATGQRVRYDAPSPRTVKGWSDPVRSYRALGLADAAIGQVRALREHPAMVGRGPEREVIADVLKRLSTGSGGALLVTGEAGIGKSLLLAELRSAADRLGIRTVAGAGDGIAQTVPYFAWRTVFQDLLDINATTAEGRARQVRQALEVAGEPLEFAPLLGGVVGVEIPDNERIGDLAGEDRSETTTRLLTRLLRAKTPSNGLAVVIDDAHWIDSASWAQIRATLVELPAILLGVGMRRLPEPLPVPLMELSVHPATIHVPLAALGNEELERIAVGRLGVPSLPDRVVRIIADRAGGNPFFAEELALSLVDSGSLDFRDGASRLAASMGQLSPDTVPETIEGIITGRIDRLSAHEQLVLKVASVFGRSFSGPALASVFPVAGQEEGLDATLAHLENLDFTRQATPGSGSTFVFKHVITRDVAYSLLPFAQRKQLHRAIAEQVEAAGSGDLGAYYDELAYHWRAAEERVKAVGYLSQAGERAARDGAYLEASDRYEDALALDAELRASRDPAAAPVGVRAQWLEALGQGRFNVTRFEEADAAFGSALEVLGRAPVHRGPRLLTDVIGSAAGQIGWIVRGKRLPAVADADALRASRIYALLGQQAFAREQPPLIVLGHALRSLAEAQKSPPSTELVRGYAGLCFGMNGVGRQRLAAFYASLTEDTNSRLPAPDPWADTAVAFHYMTIGRFADAVARSRRASDFYRAIGHGRMLFDSTGVLIQSLRRSGRFVESLETARYHRSMSREDRTSACWGSSFLALGLLSVAGPSDALPWADDAMAEGEAPGTFPADLFMARAVRTLALVRAGLHRAAFECASAAEAGLDASLHNDGQSYESLAGAYHELVRSGELSPDERAACRAGAVRIRQALQPVARVAPVWRPALLRFQALEKVHAGDTGKGAALLKESARCANDLNMPHEHGYALGALSRLLPPESTDAAAARAQAAALLAQAGADYERSLLIDR